MPFDEWVTAEEVRSYKPDLRHFRRFAEKTGVARADWIHVANSWVLDILPAARMGLRCVWVDRDLTGHGREARGPADHQHAQAARGGQGRERHSA